LFQGLCKQFWLTLQHHWPLSRPTEKGIGRGQSNSVLQGLWNINVSVAMRVPLLSRRSRNPKNVLLP
jgi:hypothetical protein